MDFVRAGGASKNRPRISARTLESILEPKPEGLRMPSVGEVDRGGNGGGVTGAGGLTKRSDSLPDDARVDRGSCP